MPSSGVVIPEIYEALLAHFGPQNWWPAESPAEMMIGAVLTQNTAWKNVERAIDNLRAAGLLDLARLHETPIQTVAGLIRPAGYFNIKARRLMNLVEMLCEGYGCDLDAFFDLSAERMREELLGVKGIGRETADSIILYAAHKPTFVVDAYTARILRRHLVIDETADYELIKDLFETALPARTQLFNEYHALIVMCGKDYCRPRALCEQCPLSPFEHDASIR